MNLEPDVITVEKSIEEGKDQEPVPRLTQNTIWESNKRTTHNRAKRASLVYQHVITKLQEKTIQHIKDKQES